MESKLIMNTILTSTKNISDILYHGSVESSTPDIHRAFHNTLNECLDLQNEIFTFMEQKGWYQVEQVEQQKIDQAKEKFGNR